MNRNYYLKKAINEQIYATLRELSIKYKYGYKWNQMNQFEITKDDKTYITFNYNLKEIKYKSKPITKITNETKELANKIHKVTKQLLHT